MLKKILKIVADVVSITMICIAVCVLLVVVFTKKGTAPKIFGYSAFRVLTGSMEPTIKVDTMVLVKETPADELEVGDVIAFYSSNPDILGKVNTHRIIEKGEDSEGLYFRTKGDANPVADEEILREGFIVGRVVNTTYFWGKIVALVANPIVFIICIVIPLLIMIFTNLRDAAKAAKAIEQEEIEAELLKRTEELEEQLKAKEGSEETEPERKTI